MKKALCTALAASLIASFVGTTAYAADITSKKDGSTLEVTVTGLTSEEESTLLVVTSGTALADVVKNTDKVFYVDQKTASAEGKAVYSFDVTGAGDIDIYSGYENMTATDVPLSIIGQKGEEETGDFKYGDVNNDGAVDAIDAGAVVANFLNGAKFIDSNTGEEYAKGAVAADVNKDNAVDAIDAGAIIAKFLNGSPLPAESQQN